MIHKTTEMEGREIFSLVETETDRILNNDSRSFDIRRQGFYPSEASVDYVKDGRTFTVGKCLRAAWYRVMEVPKTNLGGIRLYQTARIGKEVEEMQIRLWKEMGIWVANNVKFFDKDLILSGEIDAVLRNPINDELIGLEMKTFSDYPATKELCGVKREKTTGRFIPGRPKEGHFLQSILYAWQYRDRFDEYRLYYFDRAAGLRVEFLVGFVENEDGTHQCYWQQIPGPGVNAYQEGKVLQPYTLEDIHASYKQLLKYIKAKELPPRNFDVVWNDDTVEYMYSIGELAKTKYDKWSKKPETNPVGAWQCSYCAHKDQCEQDSK